MTHIVILSEAIGAGHERAATAIEEALLETHPEVQVTRLNLLDTFLPLTAKLTKTIYLQTLARKPSWWGKWYEWQRSKEWNKVSRSIVRGVLWKDVAAWLSQLQPDVIVCTHPLPAMLVAELKKKGLTTPICTVLTDYDPHGYWTHPAIDMYCVPLPDIAKTILQRTGYKARVEVTGIPVSKQFSSISKSKASSSTRKKILITGGGLGIGVLPIVREMVSRIDAEITVICGQNETLRSELEQEYGHLANVQIVGFTNEMARYMAESDLLVSKPGGMTITEALSMRLPMVLVTSIQGQELRNAQLMNSLGVAFSTVDERECVDFVNIILEHESIRKLMIDNMSTITKSDSASRIASSILNLVHNTPVFTEAR